jgi:glycosyltransferase involved in cell wall biosynthesis
MISHMYPTPAEPLSGIFVQKQAQALLKAEVELTLLNPTPWVPKLWPKNTKPGRYARVPASEQQGALRVYHPRMLELPKGLLFEYYPYFYRLGLRGVLGRLRPEGVPDIIHAHVAHPDGAAAATFARDLHVPLVVTIHGQDFAHTLSRSRRAARSVKETLAQAAAVILVSDKLRHNYALESWADDLSKYHVIYNGVDIPKAPHVPLAARQPDVAGDSVSQSPVLCTLAYLREPKGHRYVLDALPSLLRDYPRLRYRIIGDGREREALTAQAQRLGLTEQVEFLGELPNTTALRELAKADIFVLPCWNEAFGIAYLEAMLQGIPVIGTKGEGIGDIIEQAGTGLTVPPRDSEAIAGAVRHLLSAPQLARSMGAKGQALVRERFTWEKNAAATLEVYRQLTIN